MSTAEIILRGTERLLNLQERERCEKSLMAFSEYVWPVVEPAIPFVRGWVLEAIAEHLEAVAFGQIRRLLINVPPGFTKSLMTDVFFPAWLWGPLNRPHTRFLCAAYSEHLTVRDNMRCRSIIVSDRYQKMWKNRFSVSTDQFTKIKFANDKTGWKLATSVGGIGTGERADIVIVDDPNNPMEMESEAVRNTTKMWFTEILPDRLNNQSLSSIIVIQQRTHQEDVSGIALTREMGYTHLMIPMRHDRTHHCVSLIKNKDGDIPFWEDPRSEEGELAWPERFPPYICDELERDKGPYAWTGQYQQLPSPRGGSIIKEDYWQVWRESVFPNLEYIVASLDSAYTEKETNDPSALTIWGVFREQGEEVESSDILWQPRRGQVLAPVDGRPKIMLMWAWEDWLSLDELVERVVGCCIRGAKSRWGDPSFPVDRLLIESKSSGISVYQEMLRLVRGRGNLGVELVDPKKYGDKSARLHGVQHIFADGMVYAPVDPDTGLDKKYANLVIDQCAIFPNGARDDLVDSTSMAIRWLRDMGFALRREENALAAEEEMRYISPSSVLPLYQV